MSKSKGKKQYAIVGVSNRGTDLFMKQILEVYKDYAEVVAVLDKDRGRMERWNESKKLNIPTYMPDEFDKMIEETEPDSVIVACTDSLHHHYIIKTLEKDIDVISEKPLTIDEEKCAAIVKAAATSKGKITVTFNFRYVPAVTRIRELIESGKVGKVVSVNLNWHLNTQHGPSYFQRWNRLREESGGLSVHKSCHHLDMVQWLIGQKVVEVFANGALNFYGPNGTHNPLKPEQIGDGRTCVTCDMRRSCKYYMHWNRAELRGGGLEEIDEYTEFSQTYENYSPRQCLFDPQINIEDTYSASIKYDGGAFLSYSLIGSSPYEGFRLVINGTEGIIEFLEFHGPTPFPKAEEEPIIYIPMFGGRETIDVVNAGGGHGGGDPLICDDLFIGPDESAPVDRTATLEDAVDAVLTGVAIYKSANEHRPISMVEMREKIFAK